MRYFLDCEFIEDGSTIDLLSMAMVAEDGRELYQCNQDAKLDRADEWVIWNVYPYIPVKHGCNGWWWNARKINVDNRSDANSLVIPHYEIRDRVKAFIGEDPNPCIIAYYADYDWVAFCQLFGRMVDLPAGYPKYCRDLKQLLDQCGNPKFPDIIPAVEHHALNDAKWTKAVYDRLVKQYTVRVTEHSATGHRIVEPK